MAKHADILVIGGGVIGLSCAWRLAQGGAAVTLLERETTGSGASGASLGVLMPAPATNDGPFQRLQRQSLLSFEAFAGELAEASGVGVGYERCGLLEVIHSDHRYRQAVTETETAAKRWPAPTDEPVMELLSREEARRTEAQVVFEEHGARRCRATAQVDVGGLLKALRIACARAGVVIREGHEVTELDLGGGRVRGVRCGGRDLGAAALLVAAGAHTPMLAPILARQTPVRPVKGQALLLRGARDCFSHIIKRKTIYLLPRGAGLVLLGATTERQAGFDRRPTAEGVAALTAGALMLVPALGDASVVRMWAGLRPESLERKPFLGPVPEVAGLFIAAGHFKTGIALAPLTARILADLMLDGSTKLDLAPFRPKTVGETPKHAT